MGQAGILLENFVYCKLRRSLYGKNFFEINELYRQIGYTNWTLNEILKEIDKTIQGLRGVLNMCTGTASVTILVNATKALLLSILRE